MPTQVTMGWMMAESMPLVDMLVGAFYMVDDMNRPQCVDMLRNAEARPARHVGEVHFWSMAAVEAGEATRYIGQYNPTLRLAYVSKIETRDLQGALSMRSMHPTDVPKGVRGE